MISVGLSSGNKAKISSILLYFAKSVVDEAAGTKVLGDAVDKGTNAFPTDTARAAANKDKVIFIFLDSENLLLKISRNKNELLMKGSCDASKKQPSKIQRYNPPFKIRTRGSKRLLTSFI